MGSFRRPTLKELAVLATVGIVAAFMFAKGDTMFSPGDLSTKSGNNPLGDVRSHAEIGRNCAACHVSPWSAGSMADRCLDCHTDVRRQLDTHGPIHGRMADGSQCRNCHTEHRGAHADLTSLAGFDHNWAAFPLTGKHATTDCAACHVNQVYRGTAQTCVACHAEPPVPQVHKARYGTACNQCHKTTAWTGATFSHTIFSITHGSRGNTCVTCHADQHDFKIYTCYNCHEHTPAKIERIHARRNVANLQDCISCHARKRDRRPTTADARPEGLTEFCHLLEAEVGSSQNGEEPWLELTRMREARTTGKFSEPRSSPEHQVTTPTHLIALGGLGGILLVGALGLGFVKGRKSS